VKHEKVPRRREGGCFALLAKMRIIAEVAV
jgi:hypothetical protein